MIRVDQCLQAGYSDYSPKKETERVEDFFYQVSRVPLYIGSFSPFVPPINSGRSRLVDRFTKEETVINYSLIFGNFLGSDAKFKPTFYQEFPQWQIINGNLKQTGIIISPTSRLLPKGTKEHIVGNAMTLAYEWSKHYDNLGSNDRDGIDTPQTMHSRVDQIEEWLNTPGYSLGMLLTYEGDSMNVYHGNVEAIFYQPPE